MEIISLVCFAQKLYNLSADPFWRLCSYEFICENQRQTQVVDTTNNFQEGV